jgi:hypothetical protein
MNTGDRSESDAPRDAHAWETVRRWRQYDAEIRVNTLRIVAVGGFYVIHLLHHYSAGGGNRFLGFLQFGSGATLSQPLHFAVTAVAVAWAMWALLVHSLLREQVFPRWLPVVSICLDNVLLTAILILTSGATSPLVSGYFLIIMMAGLRLDLRWIRMAAGSSILGYLFVLGCTRWPRGLLLENPLPRVPRFHQLMVLLALLLSGVIVGQLIRHIRRVADELPPSSGGGAGT